ncbi:TPA: hypothetical protein ACH3X2_012745 [Trebouxia sp. C0005]
MGQHIQWPHSRVQDRWGNSIARKKVFGLDAGYPRSNRSKTAQQSEAGQAGPSAQPEAEPFSKPKAKGAKLGPRQQIKAAAAAAANKDNSSATDNAMPGAKSQAAPKRPRDMPANTMLSNCKGRLHRAFSVFLFNSQTQLQLQQRASAKITFPKVWTNTCCSHPWHGYDPGEVGEPSSVASGAVMGAKRAAVHKLGLELGIPFDQLPLDAFKLLTWLHYCAADEETPGPEAE